MTTERHPLEPFLPKNAQVLFLGSFPPPKARWSMEFFYPNFINDFWRIMGLLFFNSKEYFIVPGEKRFDKERIVTFARNYGLAFYDTATVVNRLKDNASDNFLEVVEPTDIHKLLAELPKCKRIVTTGQKASETLQAQLGLDRLPAIGDCIPYNIRGRYIEFWRMPSSSRAYPLPIDKKVSFYQQLFC